MGAARSGGGGASIGELKVVSFVPFHLTELGVSAHPFF